MQATGKEPRRAKQWLGLGGAMFLGLVLVVAAVAKAVEPGAFAQQIQLEGLDFLFGSATVVLIALALETGLGVALLSGLRNWWVLVPTSLLVVFFIFLTGRNYWLVANELRDPDFACGCFGSFIERTAAEAFWQDLLLLVPALALALWAGPGLTRLALPRAAVAAVAGAGMALYAGVNPDLYFVEMTAQMAAEPAAERFVLNRDYRLMAGGREVSARVYQAAETVSFLVVVDRLEEVILLRARTGLVETAPSTRIIRHQDQSIALAEDTVFRSQGGFQLEADGIVFTVSGVEYRLKGSEDRSGSG